MEKEAFRSEEEAKETSWLEVNVAGETEGFRSEEAAK